jgi:uncharacterized Fe-S cluster-containing radical SAM superfamily enzyme
VRVGREGRVLGGEMVGSTRGASNGVGIRAAANQLLKFGSAIVALVLKNRHNIYFSGLDGDGADFLHRVSRP